MNKQINRHTNKKKSLNIVTLGQGEEEDYD